MRKQCLVILVVFVLCLTWLHRLPCRQWPISPKYKTVDTLRKSQKKLTEILKKFDKFCKKEGIKYWVMYGTLLGTVRHKGWIPWDADLDVSMMESDYVKLVAARKRLHKSLFLQDKKSDPKYTRVIGKVRDIESCYIWPKTDTHDGFMIDIFTYRRSGQFLIPGRPTACKALRKLPVSEVYPLKKLPFDGVSVPVPNDYLKVLTRSYGPKYLEPPPIDDRIPHEGNFGHLDPTRRCKHHTRTKYPDLY